MVTVPETLQNANDSLKTVLELLPAELDGLNSSIAGLSGDYEGLSLAGAVSAVSAARSAIAGLLESSCRMITIHPWTQGAGETGTGYYSRQSEGYLSPDQAKNHLMKKLIDPEDPYKDDARELVCISISSPDLAAWITRLEQFCEVFPIGELEFCIRRARQLNWLGIEKMSKRSGGVNPAWQGCDVVSFPAAEELKSVSEEMTGILEAYTLDADPAAELQAVVTQKKTEIAELVSAWEDLKAALQGGGGDITLFTGNSPAGIAENIKQVISAEYYCALVAFAGEPGTLDFFREVFEL